MKLTQKQEEFCLNYIKLTSASEAALVAGYSPKYAAENCDKLLKNTKIVERISQLRKRVEDKTIMDVRERMQRLSKMGRGVLTDYLDNEGNIDLTGDNHEALAELQIEDWRSDYTGVKSSRTKRIKLHSPIQAIAELNKMDGVYKEQNTYNQDNRTYNILVADGKTKENINRLILGEGRKMLEG